MSILTPALKTLAHLQPAKVVGRVDSLRGLTVLVRDLPMSVGSLVRVHGADVDHDSSGYGGLGQVVGFTDHASIVMMLGSTAGIRSGDRVEGLHATQTIGVGESMLGRCVDGLGRPIDHLGAIRGTTPVPLDNEPLGPLDRKRITEPMHTGVRAIDLMTTLGRGQRMGIFAGPGVGKSTLVGTIARNASSDVNVIALIGERGREVKDFIEHTLGPKGLARSVLVVSTSDESPLMRVRAAMAACSVAEYFRDRGAAVLLIMDSVTRFAHAQRQIGLSAGEPPATRGYTPSVFAMLARLLERAGAKQAGGGSITGLYAVLVEGDDMTEPVADAARGILDGHVMLSRALAQRAHYPAIDVLDSISRIADDVTDATHATARRQIMRILAAYKKVEDLVQIGAYARGSSAEADAAIEYIDAINAMLTQRGGEQEAFESARKRLVNMAVEIGSRLAKGTTNRKT